MNLKKKKKLAMKTFNAGESKVVFVESRLAEIKDAITKQDIRDLEKSGAIIILGSKGRKRVSKRKSRSVGNVRKKARQRKRDYMILTRKLRSHLKGIHSKGEISKKDAESVKKRIRNSEFRSKAHFKELIKPAVMEKGK